MEQKDGLISTDAGLIKIYTVLNFHVPKVVTWTFSDYVVLSHVNKKVSQVYNGT